jgi:hypothetical protein
MTLLKMKNLIKKYITNKKYNERTLMCEILKNNNSDKSTYHNYTTFYDCLFSKFVGKNINFFELGLGTNNLDVPSSMGKNGTPGASLYAFREYFKDANICGADIDRRILFNDENIVTFYVDQTNPEEIKELWDNFEDTQFDIIIDDGLHDYSANITFFENSIDMLKTGGIYIIEDILEHQKQDFENYFSKLDYTYSGVFDIPIEKDWNSIVASYDNKIAIVVK